MLSHMQLFILVSSFGPAKKEKEKKKKKRKKTSFLKCFIHTLIGWTAFGWGYPEVIICKIVEFRKKVLCIRIKLNDHRNANLSITYFFNLLLFFFFVFCFFAVSQLIFLPSYGRGSVLALWEKKNELLFYSVKELYFPSSRT